MTLQAGLSFDEFSATGAGIGLIRNCSAALVPVLADKMEQLFQCVVMPTYAMSESRFAHIALVFLCFSIYIYIYPQVARSCSVELTQGMPIASNPLPPHLRVLRSVGQAAGPQMVLRHDNNSEPKKGEAERQTHFHRVSMFRIFRTLSM